jgi:hypothetical protein
MTAIWRLAVLLGLLGDEAAIFIGHQHCEPLVCR